MKMGVFGWLQADTVAAVWTAAAAIHREKNTVEAAAAAGLQPQQAAANKLGMDHTRISISISIWCCHLILLSQLISQGQTAVQLLFIWCWKRKTASALAQHKERMPWKPRRGTGANEAAAGRTRQRRKRTIQEPQSQARLPFPPSCPLQTHSAPPSRAGHPPPLILPQPGWRVAAREDRRRRRRLRRRRGWLGEWPSRALAVGEWCALDSRCSLFRPGGRSHGAMAQ
jgi:hypothetical protein